MLVERIQEPEIILVTPTTVKEGCTPGACSPNVPCNPNTNCNPFNCSPAMRPCMPECAPAPGCFPTGR